MPELGRGNPPQGSPGAVPCFYLHAAVHTLASAYVLRFEHKERRLEERSIGDTAFVSRFEIDLKSMGSKTTFFSTNYIRTHVYEILTTLHKLRG